MQTITLGRTGLKTTIAGLGTGGHSRLGIDKYGWDHASGIVRRAVDSGVTFIDTSSAYGTEEAVGQGLVGVARDSYILSTKFPYKDKEGSVHTEQRFFEGLEDSLRRLKTDYVDIYHFHGVRPADYPQVRDRLMPAMLKAVEQGKVRFPGITEVFGFDTRHDMLRLALADDLFDVIMVGYNLLNPSAAQTILPITLQKNVGTLCMFAVRDALSDPKQLRVDIGRMLAAGQVDPAIVKPEEDLAFLREPGVVGSVMEAAYRFCRNTRGIDVTLTGTGNADHLADNLRSIGMPPLPQDTLERLHAMFGRVDCVSGQ
jgi:aryl-alcohol dehydrogenase-like predicted oxidoreductase